MSMSNPLLARLCEWHRLRGALGCLLLLVAVTLGACSGGTGTTTNRPSLTSIEITAGGTTAAPGTTTQMQATGVYSDDSKQDLTSMVTWASSDTGVATVDAGGTLSAVAAGQVKITATFGSVSGSLSYTVTSATLTAIQITPSTPSLPVGTTQQMVATGVFSDQSTQNLTADVTWSSSSTAVAAVASGGTSAGLVTSATPGSTTIAASFKGVSGSITLTVTAATLESISITPAAPSLPSGLTEQLTATGTYSDNSTQNITSAVTWTSSDTSVATVSNTAGSSGLATAVSAGTSTITATLGGVMSTTKLTVTAATLTSITITPATPSVAAGLTQQLTATGTYSDSSTYNLTSSVTWTSTVPGVATVSNASGSNGLASAVSAGTSMVSATLGTLTGSTTLTVTAAALASISVTPATPTIADGSSESFTATGIYSNNSTQNLTTAVTWSSSAPAVASISNAAGSNGLASALTAGTSTIIATLGTMSGSTMLTVSSATLVSITIAPAAPSIASGLTQQMTAMGTYSDGSTQNLTTAVTWASSNTAVATISNATGSNGLVSALGAGTSTVSATLGGVSSTTTLTVTAATLVSIAVSPAAPSIASGLTEQFKAVGTYTDNSTQDLTTEVTWSSSATLATISNAAGTNGLAVTLQPGTTTITATLDGVSGSTMLTVTAATLVSISVTPASPSIINGSSQQLKATGTYTDSSTQDLTTTVTWASSATGVATISNAAGSNGLVSAVSAGTSTITASLGEVSGQATVTVIVPTTSLFYSFAGGTTDGAFSATAFVLPTLVLGTDGNFYGTTYEGGTSNDGTVFKITPAGQESVLYSFAGSPDGSNPSGGLVEGTDGNFYGMTLAGGLNNQGTNTSGYGTVFKITPAGAETVLYSFSEALGTSGAGRLVQGSDGNFYGMTKYDGPNGETGGTVFQITPSGSFTLLHAFGGTADGSVPIGGLIQGSDGNFYGMTTEGGVATGSEPVGNGVIFKITPPPATETVLYSFAGPTMDGNDPVDNLVQGTDGNFYGTTNLGGANGNGGATLGYGIIFKMTPSGVETPLYSFAGGANDGANPAGGLVQLSDGNFYGTTYSGGPSNAGTVFMITPQGAEIVLHIFAGGTTDGANPAGTLTLGSDGNLYGVTLQGGASGDGAVFEVKLQ